MRRPSGPWLLVGSILALLLAAAAAAVLLRPLSLRDAYTRFRLWREGVKSEYVVVNGLRLHYLEAPASSPGGGTPLLLIHGLGARALDWAPLIPGLERAGFHVYAPDLPGYGLSAHPDASYTIADEEAAVVGFAKAMRLERTDVAGWSMGGWIALKLAADQPQLVNRLVIYDGAGLYFRMDYDSSLFTPTDAVGLDNLWQHLTPHAVKLPNLIARDQLRRMRGNAWVLKRSLAAMTSGRDLMEFRLWQVRSPTLVMWGAEDRLIPVSAGERMAKGIPGARFVAVPGCGHLLPTECVSAVLPTTVAFLRQSDPDGRTTPPAH